MSKELEQARADKDEAERKWDEVNRKVTEAYHRVRELEAREKARTQSRPSAFFASDILATADHVLIEADLHGGAREDFIRKVIKRLENDLRASY